MLSVLLCLFLGAPITGPDTVDVGKSAIVKVAKTESGNDFNWQVEPAGVNWISGENRNETFVILLDLDGGQYTVSFASFDAKKHATHTIKVGGGPVPPKPPEPPPGPVPPPLPDGKYQLANASVTWSLAFVPVQDRSVAKLLANSFRSMASAIGAGTMRDPQTILTQTREANNLALAGHVDGWKPWGTKLSETLAKLNAEGKLVTPEDYATAWNEIATGLEAVK